MKTLMACIGIMFIVIVTGNIIISLVNNDHDNSDPPHGRSGMNIYTDHLTGCQYLEVPFSGVTPRLGTDGKQICLTTNKQQ